MLELEISVVVFKLRVAESTIGVVTYVVADGNSEQGCFKIYIKMLRRLFGINLSLKNNDTLQNVDIRIVNNF